MGSKTSLEKPVEPGEAVRAQKASPTTNDKVHLNKTQNAFANKELVLLDMFHDQQAEHRLQVTATPRPEDSSPLEAQQQAATTNVEARASGVIQSRRSKADLKVANIEISHEKPPLTGKEVVIRELSDTTANPSQIGNLKDARYSRGNEKLLSSDKLKALSGP